MIRETERGGHFRFPPPGKNKEDYIYDFCR